MTEFLLIVPLYNFDSDKKLIELSDRLCIRRIHRKEIQRLVYKIPAPDYHEAILSELSSLKYVIEEKVEADSVNAKTLESETISDAFYALTLLKKGYVDIPFSFLFDKKEDLIHSLGCNFGIRYSESPYFLRKGELTDFLRLFKKLQILTIDSYLRFPLREFAHALEINILEEKIVHYVIALESLVFYREDNSIEPAGKVIGIAVGMLLGNNQNERERIKNALYEAHQIRNAMVHGNLKKLKKFTDEKIEHLRVEVEDYLRRVLRKFIDE